MKLATYSLKEDKKERFGFLMEQFMIDVNLASIWANEKQDEYDFKKIAPTLKIALEKWDNNILHLNKLQEYLIKEQLLTKKGLPFYLDNKFATNIKNICFHSPVPNPQSFRDFYAFEQHVKSARKLRGLEMNPDWYKIPIFYFSNPAALYGHKENIPYPSGTKELDFELEFAAIIANGGSNINKKDAGQYIAGYTICNDWSARDFQREEMPMSLGPAKGKDFATSFGPYLVTPDELKENFINGKLHLRMTCHINDKLISDGNTNDLYHPFEAMIERASKNTKILPGDYFGSGTVGTGCILELRPENTGGWLKKGDVVKLEVEKLGVLENIIK